MSPPGRAHKGTSLCLYITFFFSFLGSLSKARDRTCILLDTSRVLNPLSHKGNSFIIFLFTATLAAYESSQARGLIGAAAASHSPSNARSELHLPPCLWQHRIPKPLSKTRDQTRILMNTNQVLNPLSHSGNSCCSSRYLNSPWKGQCEMVSAVWLLLGACP